MRKATKAGNDVQLANYLNIKSNTITNWKTRGKVPYEHLEEISQKENLSYDWLLTRKGSICTHRSKPGAYLLCCV